MLPYFLSKKASAWPCRPWRHRDARRHLRRERCPLSSITGTISPSVPRCGQPRRAGGCGRRTRPSVAGRCRTSTPGSPPVWPISSPTTGSVRPFIRPMTGLNSAAGRKLDEMASLLPGGPPRHHAGEPAHHRVRNTAAARATAHRRRPPAPDGNGRTGCWRSPNRSPACRLRSCASPSSPAPCCRSRDAAQPSRPMLVSSGEGAAQPRMTSSRSVRRKGWRSQQAAPGRGRQIGRGERAGTASRLQERRPRAVDDRSANRLSRGMRPSGRVSVGLPPRAPR